MSPTLLQHYIMVTRQVQRNEVSEGLEDSRGPRIEGGYDFACTGAEATSLIASGISSEKHTLESVLKATRSMTHSLLETGIFTTVEPTIEKAQDVLANYGDVDILLRTKQKGRFFLKTSTEVGDQEGSVVRNNVFLLQIYCANPTCW